TALFDAHAAGRVALPDDETQRTMFLMARRKLQDAGYDHYEISNYAKPGHRSRHNSLYWTQGEYLGLGTAAHSYWGERRSANTDDIESYVNCNEAGLLARICELPPEEIARRGECIMLALRQCDGVRIETLNAWLRCDFEAEYAQEIQELQESELLEITDGRVRLTEEGLLLSDSVFETFF
ncbi:TPA: hypothetical protein DDW35_03540, partial [Candidatus Sumerlaeota bacterium]|nr:hypothetical protein [Candidatus Sumerlaeota bacterium]